ncbi:class II glutamine amidotransferase [Prosthecomicrobium sp. N25]|uniref:class II glutamine amidotransferase n=1 Tax=Prosthecomicrobium sp. N25 TaxID=3129254 RepID=UPI0030777425
MCRWVAYAGPPIFLSDLVTDPEHSLIAQSLGAEEAKVEVNGDGFGIGWYGERTEPGLYREILPAWSDDNLRHLARQVRSRLFFAHVRAATGTATSRANCHPFANGRWLFMHNGQIGGYAGLRRTIEAMIGDAHYGARAGTKDSEALFLIAHSRGLDRDPVGAVASTLRDVVAAMRVARVEAPLRVTAALSDGQRLFAFRYASDRRPPSLYWRRDGGAIQVVSEPLDRRREAWNAVPDGHALVCCGAGGCDVVPLAVEAVEAA